MGSRRQLHDCRLRGGTIAILRGLGRADRNFPAKACGLSGSPAFASNRRSRRRRGTALSPLLPLGSSRPRLGEGRRFPQELIGLDDFAETPLVASVAAILVGVIAPDEARIALAEGMAIGILAEA